MRRRLLFSMAILPILTGCREEQAAGKPAPSPTADVSLPKSGEGLQAAVKNAEVEWAEAEFEVEELQSRQRRLQADLKYLQRTRDELSENLRAIESEKTKVGEEIAAFQKRWDVESEGLDGCIDGPLIEMYRKILDEWGTAMKENKELKEQLKARQVVPEAPGDVGKARRQYPE